MKQDQRVKRVTGGRANNREQSKKVRKREGRRRKRINRRGSPWWKSGLVSRGAEHTMDSFGENGEELLD